MTYSEETKKFTEEVKEYALSHGAELVGIISAESIDSTPGHWIGWTVQANTQKTEDYLDTPKSVIVLGYQAWDDVHEVAFPGRGEQPIYQKMRLYARRVLRFLQSQGHNSVVYPYLISHKRMAQLAGLGSFGKNSLIINPKYGPWFRLHSVLTDAVLIPDEPFDEDLCGDCTDCIDSCPVDALTLYRIDPDKCILGIYFKIRDDPDYKAILDEHSPWLTKNGLLMCMTCQKACKYGREERGLP